MYQIEDTAVVARTSNGPLTLDGFPFAQLQAGQSFFVPNYSGSNRARPVPFALAKTTYADRKFRRVADNVNGVPGFRYGRIA